MSANAGPSITNAMVLAAGLGKRMRPITDTIPKPLVRIGGRTMLDHALDRLGAAGIETAVVNVHYLPDQIEKHLQGRRRPRIVISDERGELLETGGGIVKALPLLGRRDFLVLNSDSLWIEGPQSNLGRMIAYWEPAIMDILLLLASATTSFGYEGLGDFAMDAEGRLRRRREREVTPFVYAGVAIMKPELFQAAPAGAFSLNRLFDRASEAGRLHGLRLDGQWLHVGTPESLKGAEGRIAASAL
ncbi:MAG: nucleotidyltransferase family protein [Microvirga sp.]